MSFKPIQLSIVDEQFLFRKILRNYLLEQEDIQISYQASSLSDLSEKLKDFTSDVLLIDILIYEQYMKDILQSIREKYPGIRILILSMSTDLQVISDLLDSGIHAYVSMMDDPEELIRAIRTVAAGNLYRNKLFTEALYWNRQNVKTGADVMDVSLTGREVRILQLLWEEKNNKEIADEIFLSVRSIEKIRQDMKEKLGVKSTIGLFKYAIERKIIQVNSPKFKLC